VLLLRPGRGPDVVPAGTRPSWILVSDLEGPPGDRTLAAAVRELVTAELDHSRAVVPMPRQQLEAVMRDAGLADTTALTGTLARELAVRGAVRAILGGSVLPVGRDRYSVVLRVVEPDSGATLVTATRVADDRNLVPVVQDAAREIREGLGERRAVLRASAPLVKVATPSFAAYRKFVEAVELSDRGEPAASNRLLREAIALDTGFASAWATLATNYLTLRKLDSAGLAVAQALRRPDRLSDPQRYRLEADAAYALRYDIPAAVRAYDLVLGSSPNSISGVNNRATFLYALGRYQDALAGFARAEALEPFGPEGAQIEIFNQAVTLLALGRFADAAAKANQLRGLFADYAAELLATARGRWSIADSIASKGLANPGTPGYLRLPNVTIAAGAEAAQGNPAAADRRLRVAAAGADAAERPWFANAVLLLAAAAGHSPGAVPDWLRADTASGALVAGGIWAAMAGDTALARRQLGALNQRPAVRLRHLGYGPTLLSAYLLAAEGRWTDVARRLEAAARAGERDGGDLDQVSGAAVRWLVAEAYERLGKPDSAAAMYELILDPSGVPFGHLPLRGLTYPFASRRLASLRARTDRPD
jgi:tetratricopeptide (TPR) repeat protein